MEDLHRSAADAAYAEGDWDRAALEYMASVHGQSGEGSGFALHHAGNALLKLGRYADAATVYERALLDETYDRRSAVFANLGAACNAAGLYEKAVAAYDAALADESYQTAYKALQGRAGALYELGRFDEATISYRQAAWADGNPDPGRSFNNLGLSFMALGRPSDAVGAFKAAVGLETYGAKGKATANLALAYAAMGFFEEAVREFERARDLLGYKLIGETLATYERSIESVGTEGEPLLPPIEPLERETVEGWMTGEMPSAVATTGPAGAVPTDEDEATQRFFDMSEDDMRDSDRAERKAARAARLTPRVIALRVGIALGIVVAIAGVLAGLLYAGFGYPTQTQTVSALLDAYRTSGSYTQYWVAVPQTNVKQEMNQLPARFASYRIPGVDRAALKSTVRVIIRFETGAELAYDVTLAREGVGWKVTGIKNAWSSTAD